MKQELVAFAASTIDLYSHINTSSLVNCITGFLQDSNALSNPLLFLSFYRTPIYAARSFSDKDFIKEYNQFFKDKKSPALDRSIKQGLEILEWQTAWRKRDLGPIQQLLN